MPGVHLLCQCSMDAEIHTDFLHRERLNSLCRICAGRSKRVRDSKPAKLCKNYASELAKYYGLHISDDTNGTLYPSTFCSKCYIRLLICKKSAHSTEETSSFKLTKHQLEYANGVWTPFDSTVEVADCSVCRLFVAQSKAGRPVKINRRPKTYAQSVCNSSSEAGDRSLTTDTNSFQQYRSLTTNTGSIQQYRTDTDSFQPQTTSAPNFVKKRLLDYLSSRTVVNQSNASDHNSVPERTDTRPLLHASTPKQKTPSSTDTLTPTTGTESLKTSKRVENALPPLSGSKPLRPLKQLRTPLSREEETYFTHLVRIKLEQSKDKHTVVCKTRGQPIVLKKVIKPRKKSVLHIYSPLRRTEMGKPVEQNADTHVGFLSC